MKKQLLIAIIALFFAPISLLFAQNQLTCGNLFTDPQGPNANYANNLDYVVTICPTNPGEVVTVSFNSFDVEANFDGLYIYNGNSISAPQISSNNPAGNVPGGLPGAFWGTNSPGSYTSTSPDGCLTFRFRSDNTVNRPGWVATITCSLTNTCLPPNPITATDFTSSSAVINWVEVGNATNWEVLVLPSTLPPPTPSTSGTPTTSTTYTATNLSSGTVYRAYVRSICSDIPGDVSSWSGFLTFTTLGNGCLSPTLLQLSNVTNTAATLSWTNNNASSWEVLVLLAGSGTPTPTSTGIVVTSPTFTTTNLNPGTTYIFYVRSNCNGEISNWSNGTTVITAQNAVVNPNCGEQFFDTGGPNGNYVNGSDNVYTICPTTAGEVVTVSFSSFDIEILWDGLYVYNGNSINAPQISSGNSGANIPGGLPGAFWGTTIPGPFTSTSSDGCLTFRFRSDTIINRPGWTGLVACGPAPSCPTPTNLVFTNNPTASVLTWTAVSGASQYNILIGNQAFSSATNSLVLTNLPAGVYIATVQAVCSPSDVSSMSSPLTFVIQSSCVNPQQLLATNITTSSFTANWFQPGTATSWEVFLVPCGTAGPTPTSTGTISNSNSLLIENLNSGTCYSFYVRSICSPSELSSWTGPFTVTTNTAPPVCGGNFYDPSGPSANYLNNVNSIVTICPNNPGELVTVTFTQFNTEVNWDGLLVYDGSSTSAPQIASSNGPGFAGLANLPGAFWGNTIPGPFTSSSPDGCLTFRFISDSSVTLAGWSANVTCEQDDDKLILIAFVDTNNNGVKDSGEPNFSNGSFIYDVNDSGIPTSAYSPVGMYSLYDSNPINSYDISYQVQSSYSTYYSAGTTNYSNVTIPVGSNFQILYFPITIIQGYNDVTVSIVAQNPPPRPGFTYINKVVYRNLGLTPASGTLTFTKAPAVTIVNVSQAGTIANATGFTYAFTNLAPNETRYINITMSVPTIPTVALGDILTNVATISATTDDINLDNNTYSNSQVIVGSWDPNDKMESHGGRIMITEYDPSDYLYYTIRFQNEGTANAEFVIIEDALDAQIDETTIQMISASHNYNMTRHNNEIKWDFRNINLVPKIVNEQASMGYVLFKVRLKPGIVVGDIVPNTASIFFDFNPAIITNTFNTEFVAPLSNPNFETGNFEIYPNPANTSVQINMHDANEAIKSISIYDIIGKQVLSLTGGSPYQSVDVSTLNSGIYMVEITTQNNRKLIKKLIKE